MQLAKETELQLYERLCDVARDFVLLKEEIANAGFNIKTWVRDNLNVATPGCSRHVRLYARVGQIPALPEVGERRAIPAQ